MDERLKKELLGFQRNELTEYHIYISLARKTKDPGNKKVLEKIASEELSHYRFFRNLTGTEARPRRLSIWKYIIISKLFGLTFGLKLMERGEESAQEAYTGIDVPGIRAIIRDEDRHEKELLGLLKEERLVEYMGSIVLGLNDALVELTGALAGFTLALQNPRLIAVAGLITGIAASLSMGASEYLSKKTEGGSKPGRASLYTGVAYFLTVLLLVAPFLLLSNVYLSLSLSVAASIAVILLFTFYISVAKDLSFRRRFGEMAGISLGVAAFTFLIGFLIQGYLGVS